MNTKQLRFLGFCFLVVVMLPLGWIMIPAHWVSIWFDFGFTDWISPISNQLCDGARLYDYGLHSPMPPLPFLLVHWLHPQHAIWMDESVLNFGFQAATLLLLYWILSRETEVTVAFFSVVLTVPIFFAFSKTILYDSMAQFMVVACAGVCIRAVRSSVFPARSSWWVNHWPLVLEGFLLSLIMLIKQSTGAGVVVGVCCALFFFPPSLPLHRRCLNILAAVFFMALFFCLAGLAMTPWVSFGGMVKDIFLIGSETKGGPGRMIRCLFLFSGNIAIMTCISGAIICVAAKGIMPKKSWPERLKAAVDFFDLPAKPESGLLMTGTRMITFLFVTTLGVFAVCFYLGRGGVDRLLPLSSLFFNKLHLHVLLLDFGLGLGVCVMLLVVFAQLADRREASSGSVLALLLMVFLPAAVFHLLSVNVFRWKTDNNPLITVAIILVICPFLKAVWRSEAGGQKKSPLVTVSLSMVSLLFLLNWIEVPFSIAARCNQEWPEVGHLAGARLRPEAAGMRELVRTVRAQVQPGGTVLLLPNDPNVEAWFDRRKPALSCAIIFTDQYWDRYVDLDFQTLKDNPPKMIIIGPRENWRPFSHGWNINRGAERLIDLVQDKLLPEKYVLASQQQITFQGKPDFMDAYVLRPK